MATDPKVWADAYIAHFSAKQSTVAEHAAHARGRTDAISGCVDRKRAKNDRNYAEGVVSWEK